MAHARKSSRACENFFAGFVIFACGLSIIITTKSQTITRAKRKIDSSRELQENRKTFLSVLNEEREKMDKSDAYRHPPISDGNIDDTVVKGWFRRKPVDRYVPTTFHPILTKPEIITSSVCKNTEVDILVISVSYWGNADKRAAIRGTWAARDTFIDIGTQVVFFLGRPTTAADQAKIESEGQTYGDIVQGDFVDAKANISMKGLLALQWINNNCLHAKYAIKADDDMFVNLFYVMEFGLSELSRQNKVIMCQRRPKNSIEIIRNKSSKWYVPPEVLPGRTKFPAMCYANVVLLTMDVIPELYRASFSMPYCTVDDAYIFGMLVELAKDVEFQSIGETISMDQNQAFEDLLSPNQPQYLASAVKQIEYFGKFWNTALKRVPRWAKVHLNKNIKT